MCQLNDLLGLDLGPLSETLAAGVPAQSELNAGEWLGVVEAVTLRLSEGVSDLSTEQLATCSIALEYSLEAAMASGAINRRESAIRRLHISGVLLQQVPPVPTIDILSPDYLMSLLLQELPMSVEEARVLTVNWRELDISQIRDLRAVKNLLSPGLTLIRLFPNWRFVEDLRPWEEIFPSLP